MPPRYVYWTIIVDGQPTAFRAGSLEDIMPTFNRLKEKQPTAELKWFQHGKLWSSRHDAQDFMRARGDRGRERDPRQRGDQRSGSGNQVAGNGERGSEKPERAWNAKPDWKTRSTFRPRGDKPAFSGAPKGKPEWVPKGAGPKPRAEGRDEKAEWKPKTPSTPAARREDDKPVWKSKGFSNSKPQAPRPSFDERSAGQARKPEWKPKGSFKPKDAGHSSGWEEKPRWKSNDDKPAWKSKSFSSPKPQAPSRPSFAKATEGKPEWKPKGTFKPKEPGHRPSAREEARSSFRPKSYTPRDESAGPSRSAKARDQKLEWKPSSARPSSRPDANRRSDGPNAGFSRGGSSDPPASDGPKRKWVPKAEYQKSLGIEAKRDDKWRPGGEHKDPKQKYKDAKKAKWTRFKQAIRTRSTKPRTPKDE